MIAKNSIVLPFSEPTEVTQDGFYASTHDSLKRIQLSINNIQSIKSFIEKFNFEETEDGIDHEELERICQNNKEDIKQINIPTPLKDKWVEQEIRIKKGEETILRYFLYAQNFEKDIALLPAEETATETTITTLAPHNEISSEATSSSSMSTTSSRNSGISAEAKSKNPSETALSLQKNSGTC